MGMSSRRSTRASRRPRRPASPLQVGLQPPLLRRLRRRRTGSSSTGAVGTPQLMRSLTRDPGLGRPRRGAAVDDLHPDPDPRLRHAAVAQPGRGAGERLRHRRRAGRPGLQGPGPARHRGRRHHLRQRRDRGGRGQLLRHLRLRRARRGLRLRRHGDDGRRRPVLARALRPAAGRHADDRPRRRRALPRRLRRRVRRVRRRGPRAAAPRRHRARTPAGRFLVALAAIESVETGAPVPVEKVDADERRDGFTLAVCAEMVFRDLPVEERVRLLHDRRLRRRDLGLDDARTSTRSPPPARTSPR